jgi:phage/plasmid-like protein (TIGR03299 family)
MGDIKERLLGSYDAAEMMGRQGISIVNGVAEAFTTDRPAWWDLAGAYVVQGAPSGVEAQAAAHLDWKVAKAPLYTRWGVPGSTNEPKLVAVPGYSAVVRLDTKRHLGVVRNSYELIQNNVPFEFSDVLLEQGAKFESAGALDGGARIFTLARIPGADFNIGNDEHRNFLAVLMAHDGSGAMLAFATDWRIVCQNTTRFALADLAKGGTGDGSIKIRHTKNAAARIAAAKTLVQNTIIHSGHLQAKFRALAGKQVSRENVLTILDRLFPKPEAGVSPKRHEKVLEQILANFESNDGNAYPEQRGTGYAMFNAITNYIDHTAPVRVTEKRAGQTPDSIRAERTLFGSDATFKMGALAVLEEVVLAGKREFTLDEAFEAVKDNPLASLDGLLGD